MVGSVLTLVILLFSAAGGAAQTYTQMQWGVNKGTTPYQFGANINGTWSNLGTVSSAGVWSIPSSNISISLPALSVLDYGAVADGNIANATKNINAVNTILALGRCAFFPQNASGSANYNIGTNTITILTSQCLSFESGAKITYTGSSAAVKINSFQVAAAPARIQGDVTFAMSGSSGTAIRFPTASAVIAGVEINNVLCLDAVECIGDESSASSYVTDAKFGYVRAIRARGRQVYLRRTRGFIYFDALRVDYNTPGQTLPVTWNSVQFDDIIGLELNRFDVVGPSATGAYQATSTGLVINGSGAGFSSVWCGRCLVDSSSGNGIYITNVQLLQANWIESYASLGNQILLTDVSKASISNLIAIGANGIPGAAAGAQGLGIAGASTGVNISNILATTNTGTGVSVGGSSVAINLSNLSSYENAGYQFSISGTASYVGVYGGYLTGGLGPVSITSSGSSNTISNVNGVSSFVGVAKFDSGISFSNLAVSATAPTISSGFGTSPSVTANNGTAAFRINVGTGGTATNGVVGLPTAANGWNCFASDVTTPGTGHTIKQSAGTTTSATLTNYDNAGSPVAWTASDIIIVNCMAY